MTAFESTPSVLVKGGELAREDTVTTEKEIVSEGALCAKDGRVLPLKNTDVRARVSGPVADVEVKQRFVNETREAIEAVYAFPLPPGASVYRMAFRIGDRTVHAVVKTKKDARAEYEAAIAAGRAATLLEEDESSLFSLSVGNIPAGAAITVELSYQELLGYDDGEWRFVFPMVAPERYVEMPDTMVRALLGGPQGGGGATLPIAAIRPPRLPSGMRGPDVSLEVELIADRAIEALRCPSHAIDIEGGRVKLRAGEIANRDFVLTFKTSAAGVRPLVRFERNDEHERGTFLLCFTPPGQTIERTETRGGPGEMKAIRCGNCGGLVTDLSAIKEVPGLGPAVPCGYCGAVLAPSTERPFTRATRPRDVTILVDRSASMRASMPQVRRALRALCEALGPSDAVQLIAFDHERVAFDGHGRGFVALSPEVKSRIDRFVSDLAPRGGTELEKLLERASELGVREGRTSAVVLITDAAVGNEGRLLRKAKEHLGDRRLYVLGVGPAVDRRLCARLARACGGASDVLGVREDVEPVLARFARRVREGGPVLTGLSIAFEGEVGEVVPSALPDLYGGEPITVLGRYDGSGPRCWVLTGTTADGRPFRQHVDVELPSISNAAPGLARLWAKRTIDDLCEEIDPGIEERVTALALEHSLASKYTALVAIDDAPVGKGRPRRVEQPAAAIESRAYAPMGAMPGAPMACAAPAPMAFAEAARAPMRSAMAAPTANRSRPRIDTPIEAAGSEPYPNAELEWLRGRASGELDLVFLVDETGSMGPYIEQVKARLLELVAALTRMPLMKSLRIGMVTYRDHPPQDGTYASKSVALTDDIAKIEDAVSRLAASGGGDGPESVTDGLFDVVRLGWRASAARAVVWFGDAPPHGVEPHGDGFPQGCPCGNHWYTQAESCREMGIAIYAVGCLPGLRAYAGAEDVFKTVAKTTRGMYVPLTQAHLLVPLMASAAANELDRRRVDEHVAELVRGHEDILREIDERERVRWLAEMLAHYGVRPREMRYDGTTPKLAPLCFRDIDRRDVEGALDRLRSANRIAV